MKNERTSAEVAKAAERLSRVSVTTILCAALNRMLYDYDVGSGAEFSIENLLDDIHAVAAAARTQRKRVKRTARGEK